MIQETKRIAIYARKSKFKEESDSVENQVKQCNDKIAYMNANPTKNVKYILHKVYKDDGYSGKDTDRPGMTQLITAIDNREIDIVMVYKMDRMSRKIKDMLGLMDIMNKNKIDFMSISPDEEHLNTVNGAMGNAFFNISMVFAQLERDLASERTKDNARVMAREGRDLGGVRKYGFDYYKERFEDGKTRNLVKVNKEKAEVVRRIYDLYLNRNKSIYDIVDILNKEGIHKDRHSEHGRPDWVYKNIRSILKNPCYVPATPAIAGYLKSLGEEVMIPYEDLNGKMTIQKYEEKYFLYDVEPIIDETTWLQVQQMIQKNRKSWVHVKQYDSKYILSGGIAVCKSCGHYLGVTPTYRNGKEYAYYTCRYRNCNDKAGSIRKEKLEAYVLEVVRKRLGDIKAADFILESDLKKKKESPEKAQRDKLEKEIKRIQTKVTNLTRLISEMDNADLDMNDFIEENRIEIVKLLKKKKALEYEIYELENTSNSFTSYDKEAALNDIKYFRELLRDDLDAANLKKVIHYLLEEIVVDSNKNVEVKMKFFEDFPSFNEYINDEGFAQSSQTQGSEYCVKQIAQNQKKSRTINLTEY